MENCHKTLDFYENKHKDVISAKTTYFWGIYNWVNKMLKVEQTSVVRAIVSMKEIRPGD